jgi:transmembrane sensor
MTNEEFKRLVEKCADGTATEAEQEALDRAYRLLQGRHTEWNAGSMGDEETVKAGIYASLLADVRQPRRRGTLYPLFKYTAAAAILAIFSTAGYLVFRKHPPAPPAAQAKTIDLNRGEDLNPGENKATLTLAGGQRIALTKDMTGQLSRQGGMDVRLAAGGTVTYTPAKDDHPADNANASNTLSTQKGEQFFLVLSDGTEVTLDAASSITYPVAFEGKERKVTVTGQVYLKVAHNAQQPFVVSVGDQTIRDIGTEFNVNAYEEEGCVKTTLLEGSIKVSIATGSVVLAPGQQSVSADKSKKITVVKNVDIESAVAWKNGLFEYNDADIRTVMRQFARWYNVDVQYEGTIPPREFSGKMQRSLTATQALDLLSFTRIHFRIEGRKIIVTP